MTRSLPREASDEQLRHQLVLEAHLQGLVRAAGAARRDETLTALRDLGRRR